MLLELKNFYTFIVTGVSLISIVKITSICTINTALEMEFLKKHLCCYFLYHSDYHNPQQLIILILNLNFNIQNYFPINCNLNDVLKIACENGIEKIRRVV